MSIFKKIFGKKEIAVESPDYLEIETGKAETKKQVIVRPFVLRTFEDIGKILEIMREGYTIALIDLRPLKQKDIVELKRAVSKLKKTVDALEGHIAGFDENTIVATPSFVEIYKGEKTIELRE